MKRLFTFLLVVMAMLVMPTKVFGQDKKDNIIHISSIREWNKLAKECELDVYSDGLTIELDNDIVFEDNFSTIPYFNGTFNGNHHTIKGININSSLINDGVFRITGKSSYINNLSVELNCEHNAYRFGFVGYNQGRISFVNVSGDIAANNQAGMVAGYNAVTGVIENVNASGKLSGKHYVGGIVGENYGRISSSNNKALINTEVEKEDLDISTLTIESLTSANTISKISDIGGVVGANYGVIENAINNGDVGHKHLGYNVGGIAGSQSGYIFGSINYGRIDGRKEVGGIVGQMEPAMSLVFREDYIQNMKRQINNMYNKTIALADELKDINDSNATYLNNAVESLNQAYDAIELMLGHDRSDSEYVQGKTALSSSMRHVLDILKEVASNIEESNDIYNKLKDIASEAKNFGQTTVNFADSINTEKEMYKDVSNKDTDKNKEGKVKDCNNHGNVEGDINVGGITGSLAVENDLNPEDDFNIIGATSFDLTYEVKDIIDASYNHGMIFIKRNNAGGICGNQNLGLIKNSINYGLLNCEEANYIGGIVGKSLASLKNNYAKCFIYGKDYVGGIAGCAVEGEQNGSLVQILSYSSNAGAIFGNYGNIEKEIIEKAEKIKDNWYVYDDLAAIDGISYAKKAYRISEEEMLNKKINDDLKKVNVVFMDDNTIIYKKTISYGESLSNEDVPDSLIKNNEYRNWIDFDMNKLINIKKDMLYICGYDDVFPSISTQEKPLARVVVNGKFTAKDRVRALTKEEAPYENCNDYVTYDITVKYSIDSEIDSFCINNNGYDLYNVYIKDENGWKEIDYKEDGRYALIDNPNIKTVSIVKVVDNTKYIVIAAIGVTLIVVAVIVIKRLNKKKKHL